MSQKMKCAAAALLATACSTALCQSTTQSDWRRVASTPNTLFFVETTTISKGPNGLVRYWLRQDMLDDTLRYAGATVVEALTFHAANCVEGWAITLASKGYDASGNLVVDINNSDPPRAYPPPGAPSQLAMKFACAYKSR